jgi:hypothetical protein
VTAQTPVSWWPRHALGSSLSPKRVLGTNYGWKRACTHNTQRGPLRACRLHKAHSPDSTCPKTVRVSAHCQKLHHIAVHTSQAPKGSSTDRAEVSTVAATGGTCAGRAVSCTGRTHTSGPCMPPQPEQIQGEASVPVSVQVFSTLRPVADKEKSHAARSVRATKGP